MSPEIFNKAVKWVKEKGMGEIYLHGGEASLHPLIKDFALQAKDEGIKTYMFTNYLIPESINDLDGVVDNIMISYYNQKDLPKQKDFESQLMLTTLVFKERFATMADLDRFIDEKSQLEMKMRFVTLNPATEWAAKNETVDYLEELFDNTNDEDILLWRGKVAIYYRDCLMKFNNKQIFKRNRWNMAIDGEIRNDFQNNHFYQEKKSEMPLEYYRNLRAQQRQ